MSGSPNPCSTDHDIIRSVVVVPNVANGAPANAATVKLRRSNGSVYSIGSIGQNPPAETPITLVARPWDGQPWTAADVDALEIGFQAPSSYNALRLYRLYVDVNYVRLSDEGSPTSQHVVPVTTGRAGYSGGSIPRLILAPAPFDVEVDTQLTLIISYTATGTETLHTYLVCSNRAGSYNGDGVPKTSQTNYVKTWGPLATRLTGCNIQFDSYSAAGTYVTGGTIAYDDGVPVMNAATSPYRFDDVTRDSTPTFTGTADPVATRVDLYSDGDLVGTDDALVGGGWEITSAQLDDGVHELKARASNASGTSPDGPALSVTIDTASPADPSVPDFLASGDDGLADDDDITSVNTPLLDNATQALTTGTFTANSTEFQLTPTIYSTMTDTPTISWTLVYEGISGRMLTGIRCSDGSKLTDDNTNPAAFHAKSWPALATWCYVYAWSNAGGSFTVTGGLATYHDPGASPTFGVSGTTTADTERVVLTLDGALAGGGTRVSIDQTYVETTIEPIAYGEHGVVAIAYDRAGNASAASPTLGITLVEYLLAVGGSAPRAARVGEAVYVVATTLDETGEPIDGYEGTVTIASNDPTAVFPDGTTADLTDRVSGHAFRVLFGTPGTHTATVTGPGLEPATVTVEVGATTFDATAPATAYAGVPTLVRLKAFGDPGIPVNAYNGLLTFASSDAAAAYGGEIDASRQVRMQCNCGDGRAFPVTLNTSGMQTVTVTDEFGTTDQLTIEVLAAPPAVAAPVDRLRRPVEPRHDARLLREQPHRR